jgi:ectoine hydroxylase-related dioxygenase (phytanoyl-CoA dioxygenase family)
MSNLNKDYQPFLESLDRLGFCTFRAFEQETIDRLRQLYAMHFENQQIDGLYASHNSNSAEKGLGISREIKDIISSRLHEIFPEYDYFLGHFMVKGAKVGSEFSLHQDWNIVEESKYKNYQVWIPLQLTTISNGGMFVVPGSHKFFNNYRSGSYGIPFVSYQKELDPIITNLTVPQGNVLVYHNSLFHASHPNLTDQIRIAVIVNCVERVAPTYFFQKNTEKCLTELYPITGDSLVANLPQFEKGIINEGFAIGEEIALNAFDNRTITAQDLIAHYRQSFPEGNAAQRKQLHIAKDRALENELNDKGYTIIDLLNKEEIKILKDQYLGEFSNVDREPGRFTTLQYTDAQTKINTHQFIVDTVNTAVQKYFKDHEIPVSLYYIKKAHTTGDIDLHADSTLLLNHQLEPHYALWIPLIDVDVANGCLTIVPYSHRNQKTVYGGSFWGRQREHREWLRKQELPIPLRAGQAIVFDNNLLHNSTPNTTSEERICITFRMTHRESDYYSFISDDKDSRDINLYLEKHDYYMNEKWDGDGKYFSGEYLGVLQKSIIDFKKNELVGNIEI